jgi:hypothetical protein
VVVVSARDGVVSVTDGVLLVNATWVHADCWFWECSKCECAFGPLVTRDVAQRQAEAHIAEDHEGGQS